MVEFSSLCDTWNQFGNFPPFAHGPWDMRHGPQATEDDDNDDDDDDDDDVDVNDDDDDDDVVEARSTIGLTVVY